MKKLSEQRKGEDDNVIAFQKPELATAPKPPGKDWLRELPFGTRFVYKPKAVRVNWLPWAGIASIEEKVILLGRDHEFQPGALKFDWVDSTEFSANHTLVQVLPERQAIEEEGEPPS